MKNNFISVVILNKEGELEKLLGGLYVSELEPILNLASQKNLKCLSFISFTNNTYFNEEQAYQILNELKQFNEDEVKQETLDYLTKVINELLKDHSFYIKFQPL